MNQIPAAIHLDLDGARHIFRAHGWPYNGHTDPLTDLLFETGLERALEFFAHAGVTATLFVIAEDLDDPTKRALLQEAVRRGHEIASHSITHRHLSLLSSDEKRREIFESRERLSQELGIEVRGFRAPGFALDRESLELVDAAGYAYDSSLFPNRSYACRVGVAQLSARPHQPLAGCRLVELPLPAYRPLPLPFHPCYSLVLGEWYFRLGLRLAQRQQAPLVLLFHLTDFADPLPECWLPNHMAKLYTLSHLDGEAKRRRCERMLKQAQRHYQFVTTEQLLVSSGLVAVSGLSQTRDDESYYPKPQEREVASR